MRPDFDGGLLWPLCIVLGIVIGAFAEFLRGQVRRNGRR